MGIYDRDYMREDHSRAKPHTGHPKWMWILAGVAVAVLIFAASSGFRSETESQPLSLEEQFLQVDFPVDLNSATKEELMAVPRIGFSIATRIIEARPFETIDELVEVDGIGDSTIERMKPYLTISAKAPDA